ncbi:unnamed protein product, partial [Brenthis ino]
MYHCGSRAFGTGMGALRRRRTFPVMDHIWKKAKQRQFFHVYIMYQANKYATVEMVIRNSLLVMSYNYTWTNLLVPNGYPLGAV